MRRIGLPVLILALSLTACNLSPSNASPTPSEIPTQPSVQTPASPTPEAVLTQPSVPTETQPSTQPLTPTPPLTPTQASTLAGAPAFDITKRTGQPPVDNQADYLQWMQANIPEDQNYLIPKW